MPNELLLLVQFKEKAIKALGDSYLYCTRKSKNVTVLKLNCVCMYHQSLKN